MLAFGFRCGWIHGGSCLGLHFREVKSFAVDWFSVVSGFYLRFSGGGLWQQLQPHNLFVADQVFDQVGGEVILRRSVFSLQRG